MKMSKSINDYKEAMDNIKISESFYKRTEVLLTEIPEVKIEKRSAVSGRRISAVIMSAAACVICLFGVKLAVDGKQDGIVTETVTDMDGGIIDDITETDKEADELIDDFTEYDDEMITEPDSFILDGENEQDAPENTKPVAADPTTSSETEKTTPPAETKTTTAPAPETKPTTTTASENRVVQGIDPSNMPMPNPGASSSEPNDAGEKPAVEPTNPGASGGVGSDGDEVEDVDIMEDADEEYDEAAPVEAAPAVTPTVSDKLFSELSLNNITVDITPYFDMGDIKSGEGTLKKSGMDFKPILDLIADMDSSATKIGNGSFTSLFSIMIYDENIDLEFYSIYLTKHESIVITKHSPDGSQVRETYALRKEYYENVRHQLFLLFGAEGDYELFTNLIGGK